MRSTVGLAHVVDHAQRFEELALAFLVQRVERQRRFARTRQAGEHDQLILGNAQGDVLQVVQPRVLDGDGVEHEAASTVEV